MSRAEWRISSDWTHTVRSSSGRPVRRKPSRQNVRGASDRVSPSTPMALEGAARLGVLPVLGGAAQNDAAGHVGVVARHQLGDRASHRVAHHQCRRQFAAFGARRRRRRRSRSGETAPWSQPAAVAAVVDRQHPVAGLRSGPRRRRTSSDRRSPSSRGAASRGGPSPPLSRRNNSPAARHQNRFAPAASRTGARAPTGPAALPGTTHRVHPTRVPIHPSYLHRHGGGDRIRPREGHGRRAAAARDLVQARAARSDDALGPKRRREDDALADAGRGGVGRPGRARAGQGREGRAARPAPAAEARPVAARIRAQPAPASWWRSRTELSALEQAMAGGAHDEATLRPLRRGPGPARARRWLWLAPARAGDAAAAWAFATSAGSTGRCTRSPAAS